MPMLTLRTASAAGCSQRQIGARGETMWPSWFRFFCCCVQAGPGANRPEYVDNL